MTYRVGEARMTSYQTQYSDSRSSYECAAYPSYSIIILTLKGILTYMAFNKNLVMLLRPPLQHLLEETNLRSATESLPVQADYLVLALIVQHRPKLPAEITKMEMQGTLPLPLTEVEPILQVHEEWSRETAKPTALMKTMQFLLNGP